jgi:hypothetical protein
MEDWIYHQDTENTEFGIGKNLTGGSGCLYASGVEPAFPFTPDGFRVECQFAGEWRNTQTQQPQRIGFLNFSQIPNSVFSVSWW